MRRWRALVLAIGLLAATLSPGAAKTISGKVQVIDGDTIMISQTTIRLHGIDAPETGQRCAAANRKIGRPSIKGIARLKALARNGLTCEGNETDDYGRLIARCSTSDGTDINQLLVAEGHAWAFVKYATDYSADEAKARSLRLNIWSMRCDEPWVFREKRWTKNATKAPEGCAIKGNISDSGKIYHMPWNKAYARTVIDKARGEAWFCNEQDAQAAGWRPARN